jgi:hypothetical protein
MMVELPNTAHGESVQSRYHRRGNAHAESGLTANVSTPTLTSPVEGE